MTGTLTGVGVGPGDPGLLTLAAVKAIRESDCLLLPNEEKENCYAYRIVREAIPQIEEKEIITLYFPMTKDAARLGQAQEQCFETVKALLEQGKKAVFLTIGDPTIYSTYQYLYKRAKEAGIQAAVISGVPSFCAAAARLGISLADMGEEIHIIPASYEAEKTLGYTGTRIYMKSGKKLRELLRLLHKEEKELQRQGKRWEVYAVADCGLENERVYRGLAQIPEDLGYLTVVIVKVQKEAICNCLQIQERQEEKQENDGK